MATEPPSSARLEARIVFEAPEIQEAALRAILDAGLSGLSLADQEGFAAALLETGAMPPGLSRAQKAYGELIAPAP